MKSEDSCDPVCETGCWLVGGGKLGSQRRVGAAVPPRSPYPADVLVPLSGREGLGAHNHAAPHEGTLPSAQPAAVFGANCHAGIICLIGICLFINLEEK